MKLASGARNRSLFLRFTARSRSPDPGGGQGFAAKFCRCAVGRWKGGREFPQTAFLRTPPPTH